MFFIHFTIALVFFCSINISFSDFSNEVNIALRDTEQYFNNLIKKYASTQDLQNIKDDLDAEIKNYINNLNSSTKSPRNRRNSLKNTINRDENVLAGFAKSPSFNLTNVLDFSVFAENVNGNVKSFVIILNSNGLSVLELCDNSFKSLTIYHIQNYEKLHVAKLNDYEYLILLSGGDKKIRILLLTFTFNNYVINEIQEIPSSTKCEIIWNTKCSMHIGIANNKNITIFSWNKTKFEIKQIIQFETELISVFSRKNEEFLIASGSKTSIFKRNNNMDKFERIQDLPKSRKTFTFSHEENDFLILCEQNYIILYKKWKNIFVPIQKLDKNSKVQLVYWQNTILLSFFEKDGTKVFQFNGKKFVELYLQLPESIIDVRLMNYEDSYLACFYSKNNIWFFYKPIFNKEKTLIDLYEETKAWYLKVRDRATYIPEEILKCKIPFARIKHLIAKKINGIGEEEIQQLTESYKQIINEISKIKLSISNVLNSESHIFKEMRAEYGRIRCKSKCSFKKLEIDQRNALSNLRHLRQEFERLHFENVKIDKLKYKKCPEPKFNIKEIKVQGKVNGENFNQFQSNVLKTYGDQIITGRHNYEYLNATNAFVPLKVILKRTNNKLRFKSLDIDKLNIMSGGILLPINSSSVYIKGTSTISKFHLNGLIHIHGRINGSNAEKMSSVKQILHPIELHGNYTLKDVNVTGKLQFQELFTEKGESYTKILNEIIPLNEEVPVHMIFNSKNVEWTNVIIPETSQWIHESSNNTNITGTKIASKSITINKFTFEHLPIIKIDEPLCATKVMADEVIVPNISLDVLSVKHIKCNQILGAKKIKNILSNTAINLQEAALDQKKISGRVNVKNARVNNFGFENVTNWQKSVTITGRVEVNNVKILKLIAQNIEYPFPSEVKDAEIKGNIYVDKINGIDFNEFTNNLAQPGDTLNNVIFTEKLVAKHVFADSVPIDMSVIGNLSYLGFKSVCGEFMNTYLNISHKSNLILNIKINGSAKFLKEPIINYLNEKNVSKLIEETWMDNVPATINNDLVYLDDISIINEFKLQKLIKSPYIGAWTDLKDRILSKTRSQEISVPAHFKTIKAKSIASKSESASVKTSCPLLHDLKHNTLQQNKEQIIESHWNLKELEIIGSATLRGNINGMNLLHDIARKDVEINIVEGKTTVRNLKTTKMNGLGFDKWASSTVARNNDRVIIVRGRKNFTNIKINNLRTPSISNINVENLLLKSGNQSIFGMKTIQGIIRAPQLVVNGTVKNAEFRIGLENQLRNNKSPQTLQSGVVVNGVLNIIGNVTVSKSIGDVLIGDLETVSKSLLALKSNLSSYLSIAEAINICLENPGIYWESFRNSKDIVLKHKESSKSKVKFDGFGYCEINDLIFSCNGEEMMILSNNTFNAKILFIKLVSFCGQPMTVTLSGPQGGLSIYMLDYEDDIFTRVLFSPIPDIISGSAEVFYETLWVALRIPKYTLVLRFDKWKNVIEYRLPKSTVLQLKLVYSDELLLFLNNGVWKIEGLQGPQLVLPFNLNGKIEFSEDNLIYHMHKRKFFQIFKSVYNGN